MVDENFNITGIIDRQMARIVPSREAFALSLVSADMGAFCNGNILFSVKDLELSYALGGKKRRKK